MKRSIFLIPFAWTALFAYSAEVKNHEVTVEINGIDHTYSAGERIDLKPGDLICLKSGDGRVVITGKDYRMQLSKHGSGCRHLPSKDGQADHYAETLLKSIVSIFKKSEEDSVSGVSRKGTEAVKRTKPIVLNKTSKYLSIESNQWGPLPVKVKIFDENGKMVSSDVNKDDVFTSFVFPVSILKDGYRIRVTNAFDDVLVDAKIIIK